MAEAPRIALLGFLPWTDPGRNVAVRINPAASAADLCARRLAEEGLTAAFVPVEVSGQGIQAAMEMVRVLRADIVVAAGQTTTGPRVERFGRMPGVWAPPAEGEEQPWLLAPDAVELAALLSSIREPDASVEPFIASEDAGSYFCDHLCVELVRESRRRPIQARFLHVTAVDACAPDVREARIRLYTKQLAATVHWLCGLTADARALS